jgi:uncharacterized protein involved in response to NO
VAAIPRYREQRGPAILSAGFRPFFLAAAGWAALAVPLWLALFGGAAVVAGFLLTAIPNWTGCMPLQGAPLAFLVSLWGIGRLAVLCSAGIGVETAAILDLAFPLTFLAVVASEILAGRNWRNLPMLAALALLLLRNLLVHLDVTGLAPTALLGDRLGVATLLMLISFVGGRIVPSFTRNWLVKQRPEVSSPAPFDIFDRIVLATTAAALALWVAAPEAAAAHWFELAAGLALAMRLARWRGQATLREPLLLVLHVGYGWLALGFLLLALDAFIPLLPETTALHALTVGAIGTMTLAVMTRASLGHTGRPLIAGPGTTAIYVLITLAALLRLVAALGGETIC